MSYSVGGGGGPAGANPDDDSVIAKPYDLSRPTMSPEMVQQMDEMFQELYQANGTLVPRIKALEASTQASKIYVRTVKIGNTRLKTIGDTPVTVVDAPGAGKIIAPVFAVGATYQTAAYSASRTCGFGYTDSSLTSAPALFTTWASFLSSSAGVRRRSYISADTDVNNVDITEMVNCPVYFGASGTDVTGGSVDNYAIVRFFYRIIDAPFNTTPDVTYL